MIKKTLLGIALAAGVYIGLHKSIVYPNPARTPGNLVSNLDIEKTICNPNWSTKEIRPPTSYTNNLKKQQIKEYGYRNTDPMVYEEDHLCPLTAGGNPTDPKNLWPQPYLSPGAREKDRAEFWLHKQVCEKKLTPEEACKEIATDWYKVYKQSKGDIPLGGVE